MSDITKRSLLRAVMELSKTATRPALTAALTAMADAAEYDTERQRALVVLSDAGVVHRTEEQKAAVEERDRKRAAQQKGVDTRRAIEAEIARTPSHNFGDGAGTPIEPGDLS